MRREVQHRRHIPARVDSVLSVRPGSGNPLAWDEETGAISPVHGDGALAATPDNRICLIDRRGFDI
jgi:hypothetical protein